ncbi:Na+/H+ antiporter subunit D [bacterium]|nr:Na+/H+ antiporter subunit D [bacterium]
MNLILAPVILPLLAAMLAVVLRSNLKAQRVISGLVAIALPILSWVLFDTVRNSGVQVLRVGDWPATLGIVFALDLMGSLFVFFGAITFLATWLFLVGGGAGEDSETNLLHPMMLVLVGAVNWAFSTGDLFNLFVSFEILLIASYVLLIHGNGAGQVREGFKFVVLNFTAGMIFLATAGLAYGLFGTLNMAELGVRIHLANYPPEAVVLGVLFFCVFGMKAAIFPLFAWLPDSYPKAPPGVLAYFSGILTKVGIYSLYRLFSLCFPPAFFGEWFQPTLLVIAGLTMFIGVMGAFSQYSFRRILSFHIISQIGYMIFGLAIYTPLALAFGIFYVVHNMLVKSALLLVSDSVIVNRGTDDLKKVTGLIHVSPGLALIFLAAALSLAGIPPLSGFYGKFGFAWEGFNEGHYLTVFFAVLTGLFTLASMVKIWRYSFWGEKQEGPENGPLSRKGVIFAAGFLTSAALVLAATGGWFMPIMKQAGEELLDRRPYVQAVMGSDAAALLDGPGWQEVAQKP